MLGQELKFEIIKHIGTISTASNGWNIEHNLVSLNGNEPKYDLRSWSPDQIEMGIGITLTDNDIIALSEMFDDE